MTNKFFLFAFCFIYYSYVYANCQTINSKDSLFIIDKIEISGNKTTKPYIILRELTFKQLDTVKSNKIPELFEKSKENLLNTLLFNYVNIDLKNNNGKNIVLINVEERWYIWPNIIFEHANRNLSAFIEDKDWRKINYGMYLTYNNFRGRKEILKLTTRFGYKQLFGLYYNKPDFGKKHQHGLTFDIFYFRKKEADLNVLNNKLIYFRLLDDYLWNYSGIKLTYTLRPKYYSYHKFSTGFENTNVADTIIKLNPAYTGNQTTKLYFTFFSYQFIYDKRDYKAYPLNGYYFDFLIKKEGLAFWSNYNNLYIKPLFSWYSKISDRWYYSSGIKGKYSLFNIPFANKQALGYYDYMHGYEPYVINGNSFIFFRSYLKYCVMKQKITVVEKIPFKKFNKIHLSIYSNLLFDVGYVYDINPDASNTYVNTPLYSFGVGLDLVSYYDQILRFEFSINHKGLTKFNIDIKAPILKENN